MRPSTRFSLLLGTAVLVLTAQSLSAQVRPVRPAPQEVPLNPRYAYSPNSVMVPACSFRGPYTFCRSGRWVESRREDHVWNTIMGVPVDLPDGATVTAVWFFWQDKDEDKDARLMLNYSDYHGRTGGQLAETRSDGAIGNGASLDDTITNHTVDRSQYHYSLTLSLPPQTPDAERLKIFSVVIQYDPPR